MCQKVERANWVCDDSKQSVAKRTRIVAEQGIWIFECDL